MLSERVKHRCPSLFSGEKRRGSFKRALSKVLILACYSNRGTVVAEAILWIALNGARLPTFETSHPLTLEYGGLRGGVGGFGGRGSGVISVIYCVLLQSMRILLKQEVGVDRSLGFSPQCSRL